MSLQAYRELTMPKYNANHFSAVMDHIQTIEITKKTLVVFDVDGVLITFKDQILRPSVELDRNFENPFYKAFFPEEDSDKQCNYGHMISTAKVEALDACIPQHIRALQQRATVMALTSMFPGPGKCGVVERMEDLRFNELFELGIDFSDTFKEHAPITWDVPNTRACTRNPLFEKGILYARPLRKGKILGMLIDEVGFEPDKVLFIDDSLFNVQSVETELKERAIEFHGIHFDDELLRNEKFDKALGLFQYDYLTKHHEWLDDNQAAEKMREQHRLTEKQPVLFSKNHSAKLPRKTAQDKLRALQAEADSFIGGRGLTSLRKPPR